MTRGAKRLGDVEGAGLGLAVLKLSSIAAVNVSWIYSVVSKSKKVSIGCCVQSSAGALIERS